MSFYLETQKSPSTPYILVDEANNYMRMEGRSFHESVVESFRDINNWLDGYLQTDFGTFTFDCEMNYFNSSTAKLLLNLIMKMDNHVGASKNIIVNWITTTSNEIVMECGEDFQEDVNKLEFNLVIE